MERLNPQVLLVVDEPTLGFVLEETLCADGYHVTTAEYAAAAACLRERSFDLLLLAVPLPQEIAGDSTCQGAGHLHNMWMQELDLIPT